MAVASKRGEPARRQAASGGEVDGRGEAAATGHVVGRCDVAVWGLSPAERLRRSGARAGIGAWRGEGEPLPERGPVLLFRADYVFEDRLVAALAGTPGVVLVVDRPGGAGGRGRVVPVAAHVDAAQAGPAAALLRQDGLDPARPLPEGLRIARPAEVGTAYDRTLRKRAAPYVLSVADEPVAAIEDRIFAGAYKGVTDFVTKYLWPRPARWVTRRCVRHGVTPNAVTSAGLALVLVATALFAAGQFLPGLAVAWLMTFLDTVDGKLARVTLTSTPMGNVFDHGVDLVHPPFWYAAWWYGLGESTGYLDAVLWAALWIVLVGYVLGRAEEGIFLRLFGMQIHVWRPVDSFFRLITARRNPNLALLTVAAILGRPDLGLLAVAAWTVASLAFHAVRIAQAFGARRRTGALLSWLAEAPRPVAP